MKKEKSLILFKVSESETPGALAHLHTQLINYHLFKFIINHPVVELYCDDTTLCFYLTTINLF